jgi:hypothetical protein
VLEVLAGVAATAAAAVEVAVEVAVDLVAVVVLFVEAALLADVALFVEAAELFADVAELFAEAAALDIEVDEESATDMHPARARVPATAAAPVIRRARRAGCGRRLRAGDDVDLVLFMMLSLG